METLFGMETKKRLPKRDKQGRFVNSEYMSELNQVKRLLQTERNEREKYERIAIALTKEKIARDKEDLINKIIPVYSDNGKVCTFDAKNGKIVLDWRTGKIYKLYMGELKDTIDMSEIRTSDMYSLIYNTLISII